MKGLLLSAILLAAAGVGAEPPDVIDITEAWTFKPDPADSGIANGWHTAACDDGNWTPVTAGKRWEDQGFGTLDGSAWYRRWIEIPQEWNGKNVWILFGGMNDSGILFVNGEKINEYGDRDSNSVATVPIIAEIGGKLHCGKRNLLAVQVNDYGASGGLWRMPCLITTDMSKLPLDVILACYPLTDKKKVYVDFDATPFGRIRPDTTFKVSISLPDKPRPIVRKKRITKDMLSSLMEVPVGNVQPGTTLRIEAALMQSDKKPLGGITAKHAIKWPENTPASNAKSCAKRLNNFVTELMKPSTVRNPKAEAPFTCARDEWLFIRLSKPGEKRNLQPKITIDGAEPIALRVHPETGALETMRFLTKGTHRLTLENAQGLRLDVRSVPEIAYCYYPTKPHIACYGPYEWPFMETCILPDVNTIVTRSAVNPAEFRQWKTEGGQWISNASLPGLGDAQPPPVDKVYDAWTSNPVITQPGYAGLIVDEFCGGATMHYPVWSEAVKKLHENPGFASKTFYAWCGDLYGESPSLAFSRMLFDFGDRFCWEKYLPERPTEDEARRSVLVSVCQAFAKWKHVMPDIEKNMVLCLGYLSAPPESLNLDPRVDYHVFLDIQFNALATESAFQGLYGVMEYMADYADEESLRYAQRLFRHYCIEGSRERLNKDPYILPHIQNPDFEDALNGWNAEPAEPGSIETKKMKGFSWLEGRYPQTSLGDSFCSMKRSAQRPNRVTQQIRALEPGRLYSVKLISANMSQLDVKVPTPVSIKVNGAEELPECGFQFVYPSSYSHELPPYTRDHPAYMSFHRAVFRAKSTEATLAITDAPAADSNQETAFNFVEVQPFHSN